MDTDNSRDDMYIQAEWWIVRMQNGGERLRERGRQAEGD